MNATPHSSEPTDMTPVPLRHQMAVYGIGMFSTTTHFMLMVIIPIWARVNLGIPEGFTLGFVLGCRPLLSLFMSIHAGVMMDRIGTRRVLLFMGLLMLVTPFMYPAAPFIWALILIQLVSGTCDSIGWLGAQTLVGQLMRGRTKYAGRLSAIVRVGHIIGPPAVGAMWDFGGPWPAFGMVGICGVGFLASVMLLPPKLESVTQDSATPPRGARLRLRELIPNPADYVSSFRLLGVPTIAITVMIGMMVHVGNNIQGTFYIVWLEKYVGVPATLIGFLISFSSAAAIAGSFMAAPLRRRFRAYWVLWWVVFAALILISITPLVGSNPVQAGVQSTLGMLFDLSPLIAAYIAFCAVSFLRSAVNGVHQPLVVTLMLATVGPNDKGKAIGLRGTANRVTSIAGPFILGGLAGWVGLEWGFYIIGIASSLVMLLLGLQMMRHPEIHPDR
jgi:MFS family permease